MKVIVDGLAVEYKEVGQGPLVLLLHGWGSDSQAFGMLASALGADYRVVSVDLPGFGATEPPKTDWHVADYAQFICSFIKKVANGDELYALGGHSFGGRVIIKAIANGLIQPQKVVLMGAAGIKPKRTLKQQASFVAAKVGKPVFSLPGLRRYSTPLKEKLYGRLGSVDYLNAGPMQRVFLNVINEDLREDAAKNELPTLLVWGTEDAETPVEQGREMHMLMKNSSLVVMDEAGHYAFIDRPHEVIEKVREFLYA